MRITLAVPLFKKHDAIGNYIYHVTRGLSEKHKIRIVSLWSNRTIPYVTVTSKNKSEPKSMVHYLTGIKSIMQNFVKEPSRIVSLRKNAGDVFNLMKILLRHAPETLPVIPWLLRNYQTSDILWVQMTRLDTMASAAFLLKTLSEAKFVVDYHGITPSETFKTKRDINQSIFAESIAKIVLPYADAVIVHSQYMKSEVKEKYGLTAQVIPLGVDLNHFRCIGHEQILNKYNSKDKHIIVYVGRLVPHKRIDILIEAFTLVQKTLKDSALLIIGTGAEQANLENLASAHSLQKKVFFIGECSDEDLPKYYSAAEVLVIPSVHEGFCNPILEAMACGTPVIGSDCTAVSETLGDCGILFQPNNASDLANKILILLGDEELRKRLNRRGLEYVKSFSWNETTSLLERLFREI